MPRGQISGEHGHVKVDYLSVLSEGGEVDESCEPDLDDDLLCRMHRVMLTARRFDERMLKLQRQGDIGTFAPVKGQEAAQVGTISAIGEADWFVPAFREIAAYLYRGLPMDGMLLFNAGYNEGGAIPEDRHDLPIAIPVATQLLHAAGIGYGIKLDGGDGVVMTYFGDGATSEGDFHEALNFAALYDLPVVFVCQNNQYAISTPRAIQTASKTLAQKALAYGMPGVQVDGNDILAVRKVAEEAVERARAGDGPTLIECVTYRLEVHTTADDPGKYRDEDEEAAWEKRDPLPRFQGYLKEKGLLDDDAIKAMEDEIAGEIKQAWEDAKQTMEELRDTPLVMFDHVLDSLPEYTREQREELKRELKARNGDGGGDD